MYSYEGSLNYLDEATSLGELGQRALTILMISAGIDVKWEFPLSKRLQWVTGSNWTLEEAASLVGVTRERMRQVQKSIHVEPIELPVSPRLIFEVISIAKNSTDIDGFWQHLKEAQIFGIEENWDQESLLELMTIVSKQAEIDELGRQFRRLSPPPRSRRIEQTLRGCRMDLLGVVDLRVATQQTSLNREDLVRVLKTIYPVVLGSHEYVLAIQNPPAMFIGAIGKQLLVNPSVTKEVLYEGLQRLMSYRGVKNEFNYEDFVLLLADIFGEPAKLSNLNPDLSDGIELSDFELEWIELFEEMQRKTLHRDELTSVARKLEMKPGSLGVYLSTSPIIRPSNSRRGYFRLI